MNEKIHQIIRNYKNNFNEINNGERYKWEAIRWFQDHWDIEAVDFSAMLANATKKAYNLLASVHYTPLGTLKFLAKRDAESVRKSFIVLFDETRDLAERVPLFVDNIAQMMREVNPKHNHYQDMRAISVYLAFRYPEKYNFYKASVYKEFARVTELDSKYPFKSGLSSLMDAFGIVDELISIFESDSELISMAKNAARDVDYADPAFKVLAHDIIYSINYKKKEEIVVENKPKELHSPELKGKRIWLFQPGKKGEFWNDCLSRGIMALNYGDIGDLKNYKSRDEIIADLKLSENSNRNPVFSSLALWQFANEINVGDIILAKGGQIKLLGMGYVMSDYRYTPEFPGYEQVRDVKWENVGEWEIKGINFHIKTITDLTPYPDYVKRIIDAMKLPGSYENYTDEDFLNEVFLSVEQLNSIKRLIRNKKNIIIQGPPGVGKTFLARRLAYVLIGKKDTSRVETIQFHQSYSYEDFVQGIRPTSNGFAIKNGVFYDFCRMAANDKTHDYYFVIDEINRGNLSKILGELMMLIEPDKRGPEYQIQLTYSAVEDEFFVPDNVYIIGMMNTADRSLAMMDYALRRRFSFVTLEPAFETDSFSDYLSRLGVDEPVIQRICRIIGELNNEIQNDSNLDRGFLIGHSYFCSSPNGNIFEWLEDIVECDLCPLIDEYWYDDDAKTRDFKALLRELYE